MTDEERLKDALLRAVQQRMPNSKALWCYNNKKINPTEAANCLLDEIEKGLGPRTFFGTTTPTILRDQ